MKRFSKSRRMRLRWLAPLALIACNTAEDAPTTEAPGYQQLHAALALEARCAAGSCHGSTAVAGLDLRDPSTAYAQLIGQAPTNGIAANAGMKLVDPGNAENSFFLHKMAASADALADAGHGALMPLGTRPLGPSSLDAIAQWIDAGAPLDGAAITVEDDEPVEVPYVECAGNSAEAAEACRDAIAPRDGALRLNGPAFEVPPHSEIIRCSALPHVAAEDTHFVAAQAHQMEGGHHILIFANATPRDEFPAYACRDSDMVSQRFMFGVQVGAGSQQEMRMPEGVKLSLQTGFQVVIETHYVNTTDQPRWVADAIDLEYAAADADLIQADALIITDTDLSIPPGARSHAESKTCTMDRDVDVRLLVGHAHQNAVNYVFERIRPNGESEVLYAETDGTKLRTDPTMLIFEDEPLHLSTGDQLKVTCAWKNDTDTMISFPEEMCAALMYYTPGDGYLICASGDEVPQRLGVGDGCVAETAEGNDKGVGRFCTLGGTECSADEVASICLAQFDARSNFCSFLGCSDDADCGEGAECRAGSGVQVCVPAHCAEQ